MAGSVEKVYAGALLEIAHEDNSAKELDEELNAVAAIAEENPELIKALGSPALTDGEKQGLINNIFKGRISETSLNFLCLLTQKGRIKYLPRIAAEFRKGYYADNNISEVTVTTAVPLKPDAREKLSAKLQKMYGGRIILKEKVDPSIMGGMIVSRGDSMLDGSVRTKLDNMHKQIKDMIAG